MVVAAHQPNYLPNLGFFYKMLQVDQFIVMTNVEFEKREGWQRRHKIKTADKDLWLTVPVLGSDYQRIKEVQVDNLQKWSHRHKKTIENTYNKTEEAEFLHDLLAVYSQKWERLVDINVVFINLIKNILEIKTPIILDEEVFGDRQHLLVNICKKYSADTYLSGMGAKGYMTEAYFTDMKREGISHVFINRNLTAKYPYSTIHYILTLGKEHVIKLLNQ